jgi:hypothetical protein
MTIIMQFLYHLLFSVSIYFSMFAQIVFGQVCGVILTNLWTLEEGGIVMRLVVKGTSLLCFCIALEMCFVYIQQLQGRVRTKINENENLFNGMREGVLVLSTNATAIEFQNKAASKMVQTEGKKWVDVSDLSKPIFNPGQLSMKEETVIQPSDGNFSIVQIIEHANSKNAVEGEPGHPLTIYKVVDGGGDQTDEESKDGV